MRSLPVPSDEGESSGGDSEPNDDIGDDEQENEDANSNDDDDDTTAAAGDSEQLEADVMKQLGLISWFADFCWLR